MQMNTRIGGDGTNGFTTNDMTQYFQAVPKDALEKIIWAEADKLGWFINTVSQEVVDKEKQVVKNEKVTSSVSGFNYTKEIAGELYLFISSKDGEDIDGLMPSLEKGFARFEETGITQDDLDRIKAGIEVDFYGQVQSALGKAIQLAEYNVYTDDPGFYKKDIASIQAVTMDDVMRVYNTYIKDKPNVAVSFAPKGQTELALEGAVKADVVEEKIVAGEGAASDFDPAARVLTETTPSSFDRSIEPPFGESYDLPVVDIWRDSFDNGLQVFGLQSDETPLINFSLRLDAGRQYGSVDKPAIAALTADLLEKGTANKTTAELEDAIKSLGSSISVSNGNTGTFISGTTLKRNFDKTRMCRDKRVLLQSRKFIFTTCQARNNRFC